MLAAAIKVRLSKKRKQGALIDGALVESYLRLAYPVTRFSECALGKQVCDWELRNDPYRVLP
jgi:hypothetical protein